MGITYNENDGVIIRYSFDDDSVFGIKQIRKAANAAKRANIALKKKRSQRFKMKGSLSPLLSQ